MAESAVSPPRRLSDDAAELLHFLSVFHASAGSGFDPPRLSESLERAFEKLEVRLVEHGRAAWIEPARRLLAYAADDLVFWSGWRHANAWEPIQARLFPNEPVAGDEEFYELIGRASGPYSDPEVQELAFLILAIGFRGRLRAIPGEAQDRVTDLERELGDVRRRCRLHHVPAGDTLVPQGESEVDDRSPPELPIVRALRLGAIWVGVLAFALGLSTFVVPEGVRDVIELGERVVRIYGFEVSGAGR